MQYQPHPTFAARADVPHFVEIVSQFHEGAGRSKQSVPRIWDHLATVGISGESQRVSANPTRHDDVGDAAHRVLFASTAEQLYLGLTSQHDFLPENVTVLWSEPKTGQDGPAYQAYADYARVYRSSGKHVIEAHTRAGRTAYRLGQSGS